MLGTCFLGKLEQKVKHVFALKLVTDQESSTYKFGRGTLVTFVFVYSPPAPAAPWVMTCWLLAAGREAHYGDSSAGEVYCSVLQ